VPPTLRSVLSMVSLLPVVAECAVDREPVGLLVVGDGAAGGDGAAWFDAGVAAALHTADAGMPAGLDAALAGELPATGRAPRQVLAAATGTGWRGELLHSGAPHGVTYHVAVWTPGI
jgi:hypothetical protein